MVGGKTSVVTLSTPDHTLSHPAPLTLCGGEGEGGEKIIALTCVVLTGTRG